jgi:putative transposase
VEELTPLVGTRPACQALGVAPATVYRRRRPPEPRPRKPRPTPARALSSGEREAVLETLHAERFMDHAPAQVWATLLDEGRYLASERTMYRILAAEGESRERRDQLVHPAYCKPELLAERPNELWSWDITKLLGPAKWTYYYLYVILDVFSRYVVGWTIQHRESAHVATQLIAQAIVQQGITPGQLTIHADRGSSMRSKPVAFPTIRTRRPSSRRSSTGPASLIASLRSCMPGPSVVPSSTGTTEHTATQALAS